MKSLCRSGWILIPFLSFLNCAVEKSPVRSRADISEADRLVYEVLFDSLLIFPDTQVLVLQCSTETWQQIGDFTALFPGIEESTVANFQERNDQMQAFRYYPAGPVTVHYLSPGDFLGILNEGGWQLFYNHYPEASGFSAFSLPGYNGTHTQALVYSTTMWGYLAGQGILICLEKAEKWQIKGITTVWIS